MNRLEQARRDLMTNDRPLYNYIFHLIGQKNWDTAGDMASNKNSLELANRFWAMSGESAHHISNIVTADEQT